MILSRREQGTLRSAAEAIVPRGAYFEAGGQKDVERIDRWLKQNKSLAQAYRLILQMLEFSTVFRSPYQRFSLLPRRQREQVLRRWQKGSVWQRGIVSLLSLTIKTTHFDDPSIYRRIGCVWDKSASQTEPARFWQRVSDSADFSEGEHLECDAVVVGTGAGGAVVAKELAEKGIATLVLEEGKYWTRKDFTGRLVDATEKFYRNKGFTFALGNTFILVPQGRMVGGSTAINTGTCWRTPEWILERWVKEMGLDGFSPEKLEPYFEKVENIIRVEPAKEEVVGGIAQVIARGCDRLGYRHFPLKRNAPDCDGQGVCDFGCPTDARRSTNISYIPLALQKGAQLLTQTKATEVLIERGQAIGVKAKSLATGKRLTIRARVVVLACGAIMTPALLLRQRIANESGWVGKNLSLHPCVNVCALFEGERIASYNHAPQGYCVDTFHREGILLMGAGLSVDTGATGVALIGSQFSSVMSRLSHLASFGVQVEDRPSGRIYLLRGRPQIFYWLRKRELNLLKRGIQILARIYLAAGAKEVYPFCREADVITSYQDLQEFCRARLSPTSLRLVSFHPLGTCRIGRDPGSSVVNPNHESHSIKNFYICDGSTVPTSIGVNPQETIMALATRAAEKIAARLE